MPWPAASFLQVRATDLGLDGLAVVFTYDALAARVVLAAKNGGRRDLLSEFGRWLAVGGGVFDAVTWVPASRRQVRRRGYDQGRELAVAAGRALAVRPRRLLVRARGDAQAGRSRAERLAGPDLRCPGPSPPRILLIDDVITTGASLARAAEVLRSAGASTVTATVLAAVP